MARHTSSTPPDETLALAALTPDPRNARRHSDRNLALLEASLREVGAARSIVMDEAGVVLAGNATVAAAGRAGLTRVRVVDADGTELVAVRRSGLTDEQKRRLALLDNRTAELAEWDESVLAGLAEDTDLSGLWEQDELADLLAGLGDEPAPLLGDPDDAPGLPAVPVTQPGDLWLLGEHRLLCGDSTDAGDVARLMAGAQATLLATDPPYGVSYGDLVGSRANQKKGGWAPIANDDLADAELGALLAASLGGCGAVAAFVWHPAGARRFLFWDALAANGWRVAQEIVWVKNALVFGRADYQWRHEPCLYATRPGAPRQADRTATTVWEVPKPTGSRHPTQKPVELYLRPIRNHTAPGDVVVDPFLGSGTALVACELLGRRGYGMELDPGYCDVAVRRWEQLTGKTAERVPAAEADEDAA